jgi:two-component system chemotaxis sensor kinase CheA
MTQDPYSYFRTEARELIERLMQGVLELEQRPGDTEIVSRLLRYAHTLKGAARVVKQTRIAELSHSTETVLAGIRDTPSPISPDHVRQLLGWIDGMAAELTALGPASATSEAPAAERADEPLETIRIDVKDLDAMLQTIAELRVQVSALSRQTRELERAGTIHRTVTAAVERAERDLGVLDGQGTAMRLVPASSLFPVLQRAVRDAADATGRLVSFHASGGDVGLDAHTLRLLHHALVHLVRNAVTHGIELPAERVAAGKSRVGTVQLDVARRGERAIFVCGDDGRGIDVEGVRRAAVARGQVTAAEAQDLTPAGVAALLLAGGITTAGHVSQLAGRGIGLEAVRETVVSLHGTMSAWTEPGAGTRIELSLPVSIESQEVMHLRMGDAVVSIPRHRVRHALRLRPGDVARSPDGETVLWNGYGVPFVPLARLMKLESRHVPATLSAVVVESGSRAAALGVDRLGSTDRVVVRSMPDILGPVPMIGGAFIDRDGLPRLVLSVDGIIDAIASGQTDTAQVVARRDPPLLVIDDSPTTRMLEQGILETAGYEVDSASSGEEALEKARQRDYGLFIVDLEMPGMDGFTFIRTARSDPALQSIPSIVLTSRDSVEDRARGAQVGAKAYIVKSAFDEAVFLRTVRELVE